MLGTAPHLYAGSLRRSRQRKNKMRLNGAGSRRSQMQRCARVAANSQLNDEKWIRASEFLHFRRIRDLADHPCTGCSGQVHLQGFVLCKELAPFDLTGSTPYALRRLQLQLLPLSYASFPGRVELLDRRSCCKRQRRKTEELLAPGTKHYRSSEAVSAISTIPRRPPAFPSCTTTSTTEAVYSSVSPRDNPIPVCMLMSTICSSAPLGLLA